MKKIMIVHPVGQLDVIPCLSGTAEILCERGYQIDYYCNRSEEYVQTLSHPLFRTLYTEGTRLSLAAPYDLVIGVDYGIIPAAAVAASAKIPHALISYEIFFSAEVGSLGKRAEIAACRGIHFAVCQDRVRAAHLAAENHIPMEKIMDIPVAGRGTGQRRHSRALHHALGIPEDRRIAFYMGSHSRPWTMADELIENTRLWDDEWVLVLHYARAPSDATRLMQRHPGADKVFLSPWSGAPFAKIPEFLACADLGVALYRPLYENIEDGRNLEFMGMSSGKTNTYLQHGVPVIVNDRGEMGEHVVGRGLGLCIGDLSELPAALAGVTTDRLNTWSAECLRFYTDTLDLDKRIVPMMEAIERLIGH